MTKPAEPLGPTLINPLKPGALFDGSKEPLPLGQVFERPSAGISFRPPAGWLQTIPRAFRDTLPPKAAQFKGPPPALKARPAPSYAALQPWLTAEGLVRRDFPARFADLLQDAEFRRSVSTHLSQHPEWETTLHPAGRLKAKPKPVPPVPTDPEPPR